MSFRVRDADLQDDCSVIVDLHAEFLTPEAESNPWSVDYRLMRFKWLYLDNPAGLAKAWLLQDSKTGKDVGTAAAFPRILCRGKERVVGWVLADFCISDQYRSMGPALILQKACLEGLGIERQSLWYDFPSKTMLAVYKRLKLASYLTITRFAKPLRIDQKVQGIVKNEVLAKSIIFIGNRLLALKNPRMKSSDGICISLNQEDCAEEFTAMANSLQGKLGIWVCRSAEYLNWRYVRNPLCRYFIGTARKNGKLLAGIVFTHTDQEVSIVDLLGNFDAPTLQNLILWVVQEVTPPHVLTISVSLSEHHPMIPVFKGLGFYPRETSPIAVAEAGFNKGVGAGPDDQNSWWLMEGDRDV